MQRPFVGQRRVVQVAAALISWAAAICKEERLVQRRCSMCILQKKAQKHSRQSPTPVIVCQSAPWQDAHRTCRGRRRHRYMPAQTRQYRSARTRKCGRDGTAGRGGAHSGARRRGRDGTADLGPARAEVQT
eukprot:gene11940-biopygen10951